MQDFLKVVLSGDMNVLLEYFKVADCPIRVF